MTPTTREAPRVSEAYQRCGFYPDCAIHLGLRRPKHFSAANRAEMAELRRAHWRVIDIAAAFETRGDTVSRILATPSAVSPDHHRTSEAS